MMNESNPKLNEKEKEVIEKCGTEPKFSSDLLDKDEKGLYKCKKCGQELFSSKHKFDSGTGWPSFYDLISKDSVEIKKDESKGMVRKEVVCSECGAHLGHVFNDGPSNKTGKRYCINGISLEFEGDKDN